MEFRKINRVKRHYLAIKNLLVSNNYVHTNWYLLPKIRKCALFSNTHEMYTKYLQTNENGSLKG